jgi:predicted phosphodiesterase
LVRILVVSDVHSNLAALEAVFASAGSIDAIWHLGDGVGYGPQPQAVVNRLREAGAIWVRGNHDDAGSGGSSIEMFNPDGRRAMEWTRLQIDESTRQYLAGLPELQVPESTGFTLAHGSPRDPIWEYLHSTAVAQRNLSAFETAFCVVGHTHVPAAFRESAGKMKLVPVKSGSRMTLGDKRLILNPGSVGQPRDGDPRSGYMIVDTDRGHVTWHRIEYDIAATQEAMAEAGLPHGLARRLSVGH